MPAPTVRPATLADAEAVTRVLVRAFDTDPWTNWFIRPDERRARGYATFFDVAARKLTLPHGQCWTTEGARGAAMWTPPGKWKMGLWRELAHAPAFVRAIGWSRLPRVMKATNEIIAKHASRPPHYYLFLLGVDPDAQGQGIGTALASPVLARCDEERMPAYLETASERNVHLYRRLGFDVLEEFRPSGGCPLLYLMWREPRRDTVGA